MFWQLHFDNNNAWAQLEDRVPHTLANSGSCEQAFGVLNQLHTKSRNALTTPKA